MLKNEVFIINSMKPNKLVGFPIILKKDDSYLTVALVFEHAELGMITLSDMRENKIRVFRSKSEVEKVLAKLSFVPLTIENMSTKIVANFDDYQLENKQG